MPWKLHSFSTYDRALKVLGRTQGAIAIQMVNTLFWKLPGRSTVSSCCESVQSQFDMACRQTVVVLSSVVQWLRTEFCYYIPQVDYHFSVSGCCILLSYNEHSSLHVHCLDFGRSFRTALLVTWMSRPKGTFITLYWAIVFHFNLFFHHSSGRHHRHILCRIESYIWRYHRRVVKHFQVYPHLVISSWV